MCMRPKLLSPMRLFVMTWTVARQASLSVGFFRQEYWDGLPFPSPQDLPDPGKILCLLHVLHWQVVSLSLALLGKSIYI